MAYIGNNLTVQQYAPTITYFSGNASTTAFTLPIAVVSAAQIIVTVENVIQNPSSAFTVSGTTLTFTSAPPSGTNNIWVEYTSLQTNFIQPANGSVTPASLSVPNALYWDTSANVGIGTNSPASYGKLAVNGGLDAKTFSGNQNPYSVTTGGSAYNTGNTGLFLFYAQNGAFSIFWYDLVITSLYGGITVIASSQYTGGGTPPTRTYGSSGGTLTVALSGGTAGTYTGKYAIIN